MMRKRELLAWLLAAALAAVAFASYTLDSPTRQTPEWMGEGWP
jgi:hypothetical protein